MPSKSRFGGPKKTQLVVSAMDLKWKDWGWLGYSKELPVIFKTGIVLVSQVCSQFLRSTCNTRFLVFSKWRCVINEKRQAQVKRWSSSPDCPAGTTVRRCRDRMLQPGNYYRQTLFQGLDLCGLVSRRNPWVMYLDKIQDKWLQKEYASEGGSADIAVSDEDMDGGQHG